MIKILLSLTQFGGDKDTGDGSNINLSEIKKKNSISY